MGTKKIKIRKKDSEKADELLSKPAQLAEWISENLRLIIGAVVGLMIASLVFWGWNVYGGSKERRALKEFSQVQRQLEGEKGQPPGDVKKLVGRLTKIASRYQDTKVAVLAYMDLGKLAFKQGEYSKAAQWYEDAAKGLSKKDPLGILAKYYAGLAYQQMDQFGKALTQFREVEKDLPRAMVRELHWHMARAYVGLKDYANAVDQYERALESEGVYPSKPILEEERLAAKTKIESTKS